MDVLFVVGLLVALSWLITRLKSPAKPKAPAKPAARELTVAEIVAKDRKPVSKLAPGVRGGTKTPPAASPVKSDTALPILGVKLTVTSETRRHDVAGAADAWEGTFWDVIDPLPVSDSLRIDYVDGNGNSTTRVVDVREFGVFGQTHLLIGHCTLRDATRTFRVDRIKACSDAKTGEVISNVLERLCQRYDADPARAAERLREAEKDTLKVLFYVGKADGQLRSEEVAIIRETAHALLGDSRLTDSAIDKVLRDLGIPSVQAFRLAVGRLAQRAPESRQMIIAAAERMVATQKSVAPAEADALQYIKKRLSEA